ncbi:MAG TPA: MipA/OmpV family protein [Paucimonas sp.]|nr:MipA/OmpV family protein [Paucimonas sp.]
MMRRSLALSSALLLGLLSASAFADNSAPLSSGRASQRSSGAPEREIGVGIGVGPTYLGSDKNRGGIGLYAEANFSNGFFVSTTDGIGFRFIENAAGFSLAASIDSSGMRREKDGKYGRDGGSNPLLGMGDVKARPRANVFLNYDAGPFHTTLALRQTLGSRHGTGVDLYGSYDLHADRDNLVRATAGISYANRSLMQTFFGVNETQAANTPYDVYRPSAGIAGGGIGVTWRHAFSREWVGTVGAGVTHLRGAAADSPLTDRRTSAEIGMSLGYRF